MNDFSPQASFPGPRRWIVLAAGVVIQIILGGEYAWSVFSLPLMSNYGFDRGQCGLIFGVIIAVFAVMMIPAGRVLLRRGPRFTAGVGAFLFSGGFILSSFSGGSYPLVLLSLGIFTGTGIAFAYMCPIAVGMKWFPNNKGLVTGVSVAGFGAGAIFLSRLVEYLLESGLDVMEIFRLVGLVYGGVALIGALLMSEPPKDEQTTLSKKDSGPLLPFLSSPRFFLLCLGMTGGTFAGLLTVGHLKPMALSFGLSSLEAAWSISIFALGNTAGRIVWGQLHDRLGSRATIIFSLGLLGLFILALLFSASSWMIFIVIFLIGTGFGSCFVVYAASLVELFGIDLFPRLYPLCFLGYGIAALVSPALGGWMADQTGSYQLPLAISSGVVFGSLAIFWRCFKK